MFKPIVFWASSILALSSPILAQPIVQTPMVHSHNDYEQAIPFWYAYGSQAKSIEVDLVLEKGRLYVSHGDAAIDTKRTLESLYLKPLAQAHDLGLGTSDNLHFLVDMKSDAKLSLDLLLPVLKRHEKTIRATGVVFVISGNRTPLSTYLDLPSYVQMDYQSLEPVHNAKEWQKVSMISLAFKPYSTWNGEGIIPRADAERIKAAVDTAHKMGKPFRFWGTPDNANAWQQLWALGVDVINTDKPDEVQRYLKAKH